MHGPPVACELQEIAGMKELRDAFLRNAETLPGDVAGGAALMLFTFACLSFSGPF